MDISSKVLLNRSIEEEIEYKDFIFNDADYQVLQSMLSEINNLGYNIRYLSEIEAYRLPNIGEIIRKYIFQFKSEATRAYLLPQLVLDKIKGCEILVLDLYLHFKLSDEYISKPGNIAPAHIYVRYDNAFKKLKPKSLKNQLLELVQNPRDAFYLPFTMRMLASWKIPELKDLLILYLDDSFLTADKVGVFNNDAVYSPPFEFIKRELKFTAIAGLKYYPSDETMRILEQYVNDPDPNISVATQKTYKVILNFLK